MAAQGVTRGGVKRLAWLAALVALVLVSGACRPLYLPPVPEPPPYEPGPRVSTYSAEAITGGRPVVEVTLTQVDGPGWLAVQWMAPSGREAASESVWVEPGALHARFELPADAELAAGEWRAIVSFGGKLLRQFTILVE